MWCHRVIAVRMKWNWVDYGRLTSMTCSGFFLRLVGIGLDSSAACNQKVSEWSRRIDVLQTGMDPMRSRGMELHSLSLTDTDFISRNRLHVVNPVWNSKPRITAACSRGMDGLFMKLSRSIISDPNVAVVAPAGLTPEFKEGRYHRLPPMACYGSWSFWLML